MNNIGEHMNPMECAASLVTITTWLAGIVLAQGVWGTVFAVCMPPYAWYLLIEHLMIVFKLI